MMNPPAPLWRRIPALVLLGVLPALSTTIPLLDCMIGEARVAMESHHHPGTHGYPHNHLICIQHQGSLWAPSRSEPTPASSSARFVTSLPDPELPLFVPPVPLQRPRAPPAV